MEDKKTKIPKSYKYLLNNDNIIFEWNTECRPLIGNQKKVVKL